MDFRNMHKFKPYDPDLVRKPQDFEVRHQEYTIRFKQAGFRDIADFNEIPNDLRTEFWEHLQRDLPHKIQQDEEKGTMVVPKDPVKAIHNEVEEFRKRNKDFPKLTNDEIERFLQQI